MWYIKHKDNGKYWYDFACGCHVWKHKTRCNGWTTYKEATKVLCSLDLAEDALVVFEEE